MLKAFHAEENEGADAPSLLSLLRDVNRPETRRALSRFLQVVQALGDDARDDKSQVE